MNDKYSSDNNNVNSVVENGNYEAIILLMQSDDNVYCMIIKRIILLTYADDVVICIRKRDIRNYNWMVILLL